VGGWWVARHGHVQHETTRHHSMRWRTYKTQRNGNTHTHAHTCTRTQYVCTSEVHTWVASAHNNACTYLPNQSPVCSLSLKLQLCRSAALPPCLSVCLSQLVQALASQVVCLSVCLCVCVCVRSRVCRASYSYQRPSRSSKSVE